MVDSSPSRDSELGKRRSTRVVQAVPITVSGVDALGQAFKERTSTLMINCHGCRYQSKHYVPKNTPVTMEIPGSEANPTPRVVKGQVIWVQRPRTVRELFQIGIQLETPGNVWGVAFPPDDWFPVPDEAATGIPAPAAPVQRSTPAKNEGLGPVAVKPAAPAAPDAPTVPTSPAVPTATQTEDKVRVVPAPLTAQLSMTLARQMAILVAEAKQTLQKSALEATNTAVTQAAKAAREELEEKIQESVDRALQSALQKSTAESRSIAEDARLIAEESRRNAEKSRRDLEAHAEDAIARMTENARRDFESQMREAISKAGEESRQGFEAQVNAAAVRAAETAAAKVLAEAAAHPAASAPRQAAPPDTQALEKDLEEKIRRNLAEAEKRLVALLAEAGRPQEAALAQGAEAILAQAREQAGAETQKTFEALRVSLDAERQRTAEEARTLFTEVDDRITAETQQAVGTIHTSLEAGRQSFAEHAQAVVARTREQLGTEARTIVDSVKTNLATERQRAEAIRASLEQTTARADDSAAQLRSTSEATLADLRMHLEGLVANQTAAMESRTQEILEARAKQMEPTLEVAAHRVFTNLSIKVHEVLEPQMERAQAAAAELAAANQQVEQILRDVRQRILTTAEQAQRESFEQFQERAAQVSAQFEQTCRGSLERVEKELGEKSTDTIHTTFEAMLKSADWYQKKAHAGMQASMEKMLEQAGTTMRDRAGEVSRLFASELDHYSRSYVEHAQGLLDDATRETIDAGRGRLEEAARTTAATFSDELQRVSLGDLERFRGATDKARQQALDVYERALRERIEHGVLQARQLLEAQFVPMLDAWRAESETQKRDWLEQLSHVTDEAVEHYKSRLENASNSWLVASATTLAQHSQGVIEALAKAAEVRLRDTCSQVFAGLGESLRQRLLGLSSEIAPGNGPPEKK